MQNDKVSMIVLQVTHLPSCLLRVIIFLPRCFWSPSTLRLISKQKYGNWSCNQIWLHGFTPQEGVGRTVIVITDGENHEGGAVEAAKAAAEKGIQVNVLGSGMPRVPHSNRGY